MPTLPAKACPNCGEWFSLEDHDSCPTCEKVPEGTKRWRCTVELELDSADIRLGGQPVTLETIRERMENSLARFTRNEEFGHWRFREAKIKSLTEVKS